MPLNTTIEHLSGNEEDEIELFLIKNNGKIYIKVALSTKGPAELREAKTEVNIMQINDIEEKYERTDPIKVSPIKTEKDISLSIDKT